MFQLWKPAVGRRARYTLSFSLSLSLITHTHTHTHTHKVRIENDRAALTAEDVARMIAEAEANKLKDLSIHATGGSRMNTRNQFL
jgi:hypothetical protein